MKVEPQGWYVTEVGRFRNEHGERFVVFRDHTFAGDETNWERIPVDSDDFVWGPNEAEVASSILMCADPDRSTLMQVKEE